MVNHCAAAYRLDFRRLARCKEQGKGGYFIAWIENNFFNGVDDPYYVYITNPPDGKIAASGNIFVNCTGQIVSGTNIVFTPPYSYSLDSAELVPSLVQMGAGAAGAENPLPPPAGLGTIQREWWTGIGGDSVSDLIANPNYPEDH